MSLRRLFAILAACALPLALNGAPATDAPLPSRVDFNRDIRPIFADACYQCHGPDQAHRKGKLRLDTRDGIFGKAGAVVPGHPEQSEVYRRLVTEDNEEKMPQAAANKSLNFRQIALIKKWIEQNAPYKGHWAYEPPVRPEIPQVEDRGFVRNPIDRFVLVRQQEMGLQHAGEADRITLIRRLSFDLTGLPPSRTEVDAFLADRSADAYEKVVDRLLASPHYGERMAMYWLDLVRYADSIGYHSDNPMNVSPFRDWVIKAFNDNEHFDRFTTEQLAGDLLPQPALEQQIASAYNRLLQTTAEGGAQPKEYEAKYAADRVRNVSTVWLGATMGCCQCHDHKFDPFTMRDFYSLAAFFADIQEAAVGLREGGIPVPNPARAAESKRLDAELAAAREALKVNTPELKAALAAREHELTAASTVAWSTLQPRNAIPSASDFLALQSDGSLKAIGPIADKGSYTVIARPGVAGVTAVRLEVLPDKDSPEGGPGLASNGNFVLTDFQIRVAGKPVKIARAYADFAQDRFPIDQAIDNKKSTGWAILPEIGKAHVAIFELAAPVTDAGADWAILLDHQSQFARHNLGRFRLAVTTDSGAAGALALPAEVRGALAVEAAKRSEAQRNALEDYCRSSAPQLAGARARIREIEAKKTALEQSIPKCIITKTGTPRTVRILPRGNWLDDSGEIVRPAMPAALTHKTSNAALTRLDLARWLTAPENPLTSRVFVNRLWKLFFGQGLAKTLDDLGAQGEWPTHPELLDWLAVEFVARDWDVKALVRLLVTSGTYRQTSQPTPRQKELDPYNRYLARQTSFRLDAEVVRDNALAVSGLLNKQIGGPSVFPYQPVGYWSALNFPPREWQADTGDKLYRRGMYTHWQRSFPHPSLLAFDAPSREECTVERPRSNIPQQALVLLNDPTYVEAARVFAARILREGGSDDRARAARAFSEVLSRQPTAEEVQVLVNLHAKHRGDFLADKDSALKLLHTGAHPLPPGVDPAELAAWTSVARALLNLHETVTRP